MTLYTITRINTYNIYNIVIIYILVMVVKGARYIFQTIKHWVIECPLYGTQVLADLESCMKMDYFYSRNVW